MCRIGAWTQALNRPTTLADDSNHGKLLMAQSLPPNLPPNSLPPVSSPEESLACLRDGELIDGYVLHEKLGEGGCGVVFRATLAIAPGKSFALKVVRPDRLMKRKVAARFEQEVRLARGISHPHIVAAPDSGHWRGLAYLVMEFVAALISRARNSSTVIVRAG